MGSGKHLIVSATGFPGTNQTWRFIQQAWREPLEGLAALAGNKVIVSGVNQLLVPIGQPMTYNSGYISYNNEILPFTGGQYQTTITLIEDTENVNYDVDTDNDGQQDSLPAYKVRSFRFGTGGIVTFPFSDLVRLKTIKDLSQFALPSGVVIDATYIKFTQAMLDKLNGIQAGAEVNVQADWNMTTPGSDAYIKNKPFNGIYFTSGTQVTLNTQQGQNMFNYSYNYAYVYPPSGYTVNNLAAFIPSIGEINFKGDVDSNDSLWCTHTVQLSNNRIVVTCNNSENRSRSIINFLAIWTK